MFIILKGTLFNFGIVIRRRGSVGLEITGDLGLAKKFDTRKEAKEFMQGHNAENSIDIMSVKEYKEKIK